MPNYNRKRVLADSFHRCYYCGHPLTLSTMHVDHVLPKSRGGPDDEENLVAACQRCNSEKGDQTLDEWKTRPQYVTDAEFEKLIAEWEHGEIERADRLLAVKVERDAKLEEMRERVRVHRKEKQEAYSASLRDKPKKIEKPPQVFPILDGNEDSDDEDDEPVDFDDTYLDALNSDQIDTLMEAHVMREEAKMRRRNR